MLVCIVAALFHPHYFWSYRFAHTRRRIAHSRTTPKAHGQTEVVGLYPLLKNLDKRIWCLATISPLSFALRRMNRLWMYHSSVSCRCSDLCSCMARETSFRKKIKGCRLRIRGERFSSPSCVDFAADPLMLSLEYAMLHMSAQFYYKYFTPNYMSI